MPHRAAEPGDKTALFGIVSVLFGLLVGVLAVFALLMWLDARNARNDATQATSMPGMDMSSSASLGALTSFAGAAPANAPALASAHRAYPAALPAAPAGPIADVHLELTDITVQIAPGVKYAAWAWAGGAPGPVIHVRQGQLVKITLTNNGAIPHSVDFHAARIAPNIAFGDVLPGVTHPLTAKPGDLVRFWVVDAGPSLDTDFHIVGTVMNTAYTFGDMNPANALHDVQTVTVPPVAAESST